MPVQLITLNSTTSIKKAKFTQLSKVESNRQFPNIVHYILLTAYDGWATSYLPYLYTLGRNYKHEYAVTCLIYTAKTQKCRESFADNHVIGMP